MAGPRIRRAQRRKAVTYQSKIDQQMVDFGVRQRPVGSSRFRATERVRGSSLLGSCLVIIDAAGSSFQLGKLVAIQFFEPLIHGIKAGNYCISAMLLFHKNFDLPLVEDVRNLLARSGWVRIGLQDTTTLTAHARVPTQACRLGRGMDDPLGIPVRPYRILKRQD